MAGYMQLQILLVLGNINKNLLSEDLATVLCWLIKAPIEGNPFLYLY